ncbi:MAG: cation:proton antiporter, partial [Planctomycetota bacterium]
MNATLLVTTTGIEGAFLSDLLVILGAAAIVAVLLQRIHLAAIAGYLITGAVIGPSALGLVASPERLEDISHLAIILLMFGIGLHLHLSVFRRGLSRMVLAGAASCFFSLLVGWPIASAFGLSLPAALAVAMASSLSSTAVVMRIITAKRQIHHLSGRMSLSILVVQDLAVLGMLALLPSLARWNGLDTEAPLTSAISIQGASGWLH